MQSTLFQLPKLVKCLMAASLFFVIFYCPSCFPPVEEDKTSIYYSLQDPEIQKIINAQDERLSDTLLTYLHAGNPAFRLLASKAFASFKDSNAISSLLPLLEDPYDLVVQQTVFSLGQIGSSLAESALINKFLAVDSIGPYLKTNSMILEALGKCATDSTLQLICNVKGYKAKDTLLLYGQMMSLYQFGLRNKFCKAANDRVIELACNSKYPEQVRLIAAHFIQRFKTLEWSSYNDLIKKACIDEKNVDVRMCLVGALANIGNPESLTTLEELYGRGLDSRIQTNIFRNISSYKNGSASSLALRASQNPSLHVAIPATEYLVEYGNPEIMEDIKALYDQPNLPWQVKTLMCKAMLKKLPDFKKLTRLAIIENTKSNILQSKNPYERAAYIEALSIEKKELPFILSIAKSKQAPIVVGAITEAVKNIIHSAEFPLIFKGPKNFIYLELMQFFNAQADAADAGSLAIMAEIFEKDHFILDKYVRPDSLLSLAQSKLKLPKEVETWNALEKTISRYRKIPYVAKKLTYNHPLTWNKIADKPDTIFAKINTNKGEMKIALYPKEAPATVANFIQLIEDGFYKDKIFHRVVPNFVIQTGCPRGDGYGGLDYTIRTEIGSLNYLQSGMLGMASAGPDTECTQFFITHSATPHLNGRYTIFGKLISGMDVLLSIQQGDKINDINLE